MAHGILIVFYHDNNQPYLKAAIKCAEKFNDTVVLLGSECNKNFCPDWYDASKFTETGYEKFEKFFVNMSSNTAEFEIACFKRYFMLYKYMCMNNIDRAMMLDSDVLCYINCSSPEFLNLLNDKVIAFSAVGKWTGQACGPQFLYVTRYALKNFIDFCLDMYKNHIDVLKKKYHDGFIVTGANGGICDMQLLGMYCRTLDRNNILNWSEQDIFLIDHTVMIPSAHKSNQFRMDKLLTIKDIKYIDGYPYFYDLEKKQWVRASIIHFQGLGKKFMCDFFYGRPYIVKLIHSVGIHLRRIMPKSVKQFIKKLLGRK